VSIIWVDDEDASNAPTSLSFVSSTTSQASTITCPTVEAGDIGVLWDVAGDNSPPAAVVPSGWTAISNLNVDAGTYAIRAILSYKIFAGTEDGSSITGMAGNNSEPKVLLLFRPNAGSVVSALELQSPWNAFCADADPPTQTISASGQPAPLIRIAAVGRVAGTPIVTLNGTFDATVLQGDGNAYAKIAYAIQNSSPSDDNAIDTNIASGAQALVSGWIRAI
jgi:hypothetical protein